MSRAFVKETGPEAPPPERMVADGPNLVTRRGLAQIIAHVTRLEGIIKAEANELLRETAARDLRYWHVKHASAQLTEPSFDGSVAFGTMATILRAGRRQSVRIVGTDEADPSQGLIGIGAPLAQALLGAREGDVIDAPPPLGEITVITVCS